MEKITRQQALEYELRASAWWAGLLSADWLQRLAARCFTWKVRRKYRAYEASLREREEAERALLVKMVGEVFTKR